MRPQREHRFNAFSAQILVHKSPKTRVLAIDADELNNETRPWLESRERVRVPFCNAAFYRRSQRLEGV
jgi:hypothetical protein